MTLLSTRGRNICLCGGKKRKKSLLKVYTMRTLDLSALWLPCFPRTVIYPSYFTLNYPSDGTNEMWPVAGRKKKKKTLGGKTTDIFLFLDAINNDLYSFWGDQQRETPAVQYSHIINRFSLTVWRWKTNPHVKQGNCKKKNINYTPAKSFCEMSKTSLVLSKSDLKWIYFSFSYWNS